MPFVAILERERPGAPERLIALVTVQDGKTVWIDAHGEHDYPIVEPTPEALRMLQSPVSQGDRRGLFFEDSSAFQELREHVGQRYAFAG
jgi:hypothetical protein